MATGGWGGEKGIGYKGTRGIILGGGDVVDLSTVSICQNAQMHRIEHQQGLDFTVCIVPPDKGDISGLLRAVQLAL